MERREGILSGQMYIRLGLKAQGANSLSLLDHCVCPFRNTSSMTCKMLVAFPRTCRPAVKANFIQQLIVRVSSYGLAIF